MSDTVDDGAAIGPAQTDDWVGVTRLQQAYADAVTRRDWSAVHGLFVPDAVVSLDLVARPPRDITGPDELVSFISGALERFEFFEFVVLTSHVDLWPGGDRDAATARVFMCELRRVHGEDQRHDAFGLYRDRYARVDGRWRFADRRYRSIGTFPGGQVFPLPSDLT